MNDLVCSMCGKPNPPDAEVCGYCQARLKPLFPAAQEEPEIGSGGTHLPASQVGEQPDEKGAEDWVQDLRSVNREESSHEAMDGAGFGGEATKGAEEFFPAVEPEEFPVLPIEPPAPDAEGSVLPEEEADEAARRSADLPDWLSRISEASEAGPGKREPAATASWLEEMRPPYDQTPTRPEESRPERPETTGPLAGLRGVLSARPEAIRSRKPVVFSDQLKVTANQRAHADLLKALLETEGAPQPVPPRKTIRSEYLLRWGIFLVLLLVLLWPALTGVRSAPFPIYQEEAAELNRLVNQLPEKAPVLIGFDYDPGLSAEVEAAAATVVDHLMLRGAYLTLVSTSPTGPLLAERFMQVIQAEHDYASGVNYVNLGYIPGGPVGLLNFVESPQRSLPYTLEGVPAWETAGQEGLPPLQGVAVIEDFAMILVLADDPDTARAWVEQLEVRLGGLQTLTSLVMVTSAQVEPVILPYYLASPRQVHGLVAGLRGGAVYARLTGRPGQPGRFWDGYGAGLFVSALVVLVGGLVSTLLPLVRRPAQAEEVGR
jgi:ribosomal protein L40E